MKLAEYLAKENIRPSQFAQRIGVPPSTVIRWVNGEREPRIAAMLTIESATEGAVTPADFIAAAQEATPQSFQESGGAQNAAAAPANDGEAV